MSIAFRVTPRHRWQQTPTNVAGGCGGHWSVSASLSDWLRLCGRLWFRRGGLRYGAHGGVLRLPPMRSVFCVPQLSFFMRHLSIRLQIDFTLAGLSDFSGCTL